MLLNAYAMPLCGGTSKEGCFIKDDEGLLAFDFKKH
jgi:hypothetical protein